MNSPQPLTGSVSRSPPSMPSVLLGFCLVEGLKEIHKIRLVERKRPDHVCLARMPGVEAHLSVYGVTEPALGISRGGECEAQEDTPPSPILSWPYWGQLPFLGCFHFIKNTFIQ